ncbi:MAG: biotin/lipoyl-binding protein [Candidatus Hydrogenedentes bacterium]|nr:biotin/lipoyl-binding protein [Candidatus Hydrogenedentota bacterium]
MRIEVPLPSLGEEEDAVRGGTIALWHVEEGATVQEGGDLLELNTDKAAFVVSAPVSGRLVEKRVSEGDEVSVGDILCVLET